MKKTETHITRDRMDGKLRKKTGDGNNFRDHRMREQIDQSIGEIPVLIFGEIAKDALIQGLFVESGLHVNLKTVGRFSEMPHTGRGGENQRA